MRYAGFSTGSESYMLDHMAPLASVLEMPLITTEETTCLLARKFYPQVEVRFMPDLENRLQEIAKNFDVLFECKYWNPQLKQIFRDLYQKEMHLVFCPHGQSDKGLKALAQFGIQDKVLVYGDLLLEMLKKDKIDIPPYAIVGNYRLPFYQKNKKFYDALAEKEFFSKLKKANRTLLYAPTWNDLDKLTSFFDYGAKVIADLPSDWNLILKLHPQLEGKDPARYYPLAALAENRPNIAIVENFPPIYPILSQADIYLGDFSSIGYDFLYFQRPMFFFPAQNPGRLHSCGQILDPKRNLYEQMQKPNRKKKNQKELYDLAFKSE